ncbi:uncharacterized protein LOC143363470 [Halictus rubicundus]|uniref:uncharacterized protein LOC143363194 n=1 Tax=Halictus rubicundus TaxID=77578 RepID=UPI00403581D8
MEVPLATRDLIIKLREDSLSIRKIGQIVKRTHSSVQYILEKYAKTKSIQSLQRTGRPQKLDTNHKRAILRTIRCDPQTSAPILASMIENDYNIKVVPETIRNVMRKAGYNSRTARRTPFLHTPPQSPDINAIEHLWGEIKRNLKKYTIKNKEDLKSNILLEWENIQPSTIQKLVQTMPKRMQEIIKLKGGPTDH